MLPETGTCSWPIAKISPKSKAGRTALGVQWEALLSSAEPAPRLSLESALGSEVQGALSIRKFSGCSLSQSVVLSFTSQSLSFSVCLEAVIPRILLDRESYCFSVLVCV